MASEGFVFGQNLADRVILPVEEENNSVDKPIELSDQNNVKTDETKTNTLAETNNDNQATELGTSASNKQVVSEKKEDSQDKNIIAKEGKDVNNKDYINTADTDKVGDAKISLQSSCTRNERVVDTNKTEPPVKAQETELGNNKDCSSKDDKLNTKDVQLQSGTKRKFEAITGEEDEVTVFEAVVRLFSWDLDTAKWVEKGRGILKLNDLKDSVRDSRRNFEDKKSKEAVKSTDSGKSVSKNEECNNDGDDSNGKHDDQPTEIAQTTQSSKSSPPSSSPVTHSPEYSRLIMRVSGTLRIILNLKINPDYIKIMPADDEKTNVFRFSDGQNLWAIGGSVGDISKLRKAMDSRLTALKKAKS